MKKSVIYFAILLIVLTQTALADVKVKIRQTMAGQTYENTTYIKGKRQRAEQNMGGMQQVTITQCDLRRDVRLMPMAKTYMIDPFGDAVTQEKPSVTQTKSTAVSSGGGIVTTTITTKDTGERKQMFGYTARHLIITMETVPSADSCLKDKTKMQTDGWYIDAEWNFECDRGYVNYQNYAPQQKAGCTDKYNVKTIGTAKRGYPVYEKMTMFDESGDEMTSFTNEVVEISKATLDQALFEIPTDYREVKNTNELYASMSKSSNYSSQSSNQNNSSLNTTIKNSAGQTTNAGTTIGAKKAGVVRIGMAAVKTGSVGDGINAQDLAAAIKNTLAEYLKSPKIELVDIQAKLPATIDAEAKEKECDYVIYANVSHKKGGGGFGVFSKIAPVVGGIIPSTGATSTVAGAVATESVYTAASMSGNIKSKDEISLDVKLSAPGSAAAVVSKQVKAKAKSDGEDIISPLVEQIAQAIFDAVAK
ncbi:MAG TPA: hypothetical protein VGC76_04660 [Pyrinomonadaceae bacterium]